MQATRTKKSLSKRVLPLSIAACLGAGCTTAIKVESINKHVKPDGLVYYVPTARFDVDVTREITDCFPGMSMSKAEYDRFLNSNPGLVTIKVAAKVNERYIADAANPYLWRYPELDEKTKITDVDVTLYDNGTLKSINASVDDRTGSIAGDVINGVATLVATSSGFTFPAAIVKTEEFAVQALEDRATDAAGIVKVPSYCSQKVLIALQKKNSGAKRLNEIKKDLQQIKTGKKVPKDCSKQSGADRKVCLERAELELSEERRIVEAEIAKQLKVLRKQVSYTKVPDFIAKSEGKKTVTIRSEWSSPMSLSVHDRREWFNFPKILAEKKFDGLRLLFEQQRNASDLEMRVEIIGNSAAASGTQTAEPGSEGLVYRQPVDGLLSIGHKESARKSPQEKLVDTVVSVPQAGILSRLPLKNGPFDENALEVEFAANGTLTKLAFNSKAGAEAQSRTLLENIQTLQQFREAKVNEDITKLDRKTALIEAETALLKAQKAKRDAQNALAVDDEDG